MKAVRLLVIIIFLAMIGGGAFFFLKIHKPMAEDYERLRNEKPELDRARSELKKYKDRERWVPAAADSLRAGLKEEIEAGKVEVVSAGDRIIINIKEQSLYMPDSVTFSIEGTPIREKLASLLKDLRDIKDKEIYVGNSTHPVPAQRKGRVKIPARSALEIASDRSAALVKYFESKGVSMASLCAVAYADKMPDYGFGIKTDKTVIIIAQPPVIVESSPKQARDAQQRPAAAGGAQPQMPKPVPIQPAPPRTQ